MQFIALQAKRLEVLTSSFELRSDSSDLQADPAAMWILCH